MHPTVESSSAVCFLLRSQALRCAAHQGVKLCSVHPTAESGLLTFSKNSEVCIPLRYQAPRCASYRGVKLRGVLHTGESSSAVCCTPGSQALRCASHRGVKLHTVESKSKFLESLVAFKGTIRRIPFRGEQLYHVRKDLKETFFFANTKILTPQSRIFLTL